MKKLWRQFYLGAASYWLVSARFLTLGYECDFGEATLTFTGFPAIARSSTPWVSSLHGKMYPVGFLLNMAVWFVALNALAVVVKRTALSKRLSTGPNARPILANAVIITTIAFVLVVLADLFLLHWWAQDEFFWFNQYHVAWGGFCNGSSRHLHFPDGFALPLVLLVVAGIVTVLATRPIKDLSK